MGTNLSHCGGGRCHHRRRDVLFFSSKVFAFLLKKKKGRNPGAQRKREDHEKRWGARALNRGEKRKERGGIFLGKVINLLGTKVATPMGGRGKGKFIRIDKRAVCCLKGRRGGRGCSKRSCGIV